MEVLRLNIYAQDGSIRAVANQWEFHDTYMGEQYLTLTISYHTPIAWAVGDYIIYRNQRYYLNYVPTTTQQARINSVGNAFVYENIKFDNLAGTRLTNCMVLDVTPTTGDYIASEGTNYTGSSVFMMYCAETTVRMKDAQGVWHDVTLSPVAYIGGVVQANLNRLYPQENWRVDVNAELVGLEDKVISFNKWYVPQALQEIHDVWDVDYVIIGTTIKIGYSLANVTGDESESYVFGYGKGYAERGSDGKSLFTIKRVSNSSQKIITRLRAVGSTKNMPYRYYNKRFGLPQSMFVSNLQLPDTFLPYTGTPAQKGETDPDNKTEGNANRDAAYHDESGNPLLRHVLGDSNDAYIDKGDDAASCPEGIREGAAFWDGSDSELKEIYPTIQEGTYLELRAANIPDMDGRVPSVVGRLNAYPHYGDQERIDEILGVDENTNIGDGVIAEADVTSQQITAYLARLDELTESVTIDDEQSWDGTRQTLFSVTKEQDAGNYFTAPSTQHVKVYAKFTSTDNLVKVTAFLVMAVRFTPSSGGNETVIGTYILNLGEIKPTGNYVSANLPELPDSRWQSDAQMQRIQLTQKGHVRIAVNLAANIYGVSGHTISSGTQCNFSYYIDSPNADVLPEYVWGPVSASDLFVNQPFCIYIKDIGIDMSNIVTTGENATIHFNTGQCGGREFNFNPNNVEPYTDTTTGKKGWKLEITERIKDDALHAYYPNMYNRIEAGDRYVLLNIEFPEVFIKMAEIRLLAAATEYLADNDETKYIYEPKIDSIYIGRNYDKCLADGHLNKSVYMNLYAGYKMSLRGIPDSEEQVLPILDNITIQSVTIKEGGAILPQIDIVLNDELEQTTLQKITTSVDRIYGSIFNTNRNTSLAPYIPTLISLINSEGAKLFLSKKNADTAAGRIQFQQGLSIGNALTYLIGPDGDATLRDLIFRNALHSTLQSLNYTGPDIISDRGFQLWEDEKGYSHIIADFLSVRMKAFFASLEIRKVQYSAGNILLGGAGANIELVKPVDNNGNIITSGPIAAYRCYFKGGEDGTVTHNEWHIGDQAMCRTFNIDAGRSTNVSNKAYWRLVIRTGSSKLDVNGNNETKKYHYVDLCNVRAPIYTDEQGVEHDDGIGYDRSSNDIPEAGDAIAQVGNQIDPQRMNIIQMCATGDDAPSISEFAGINDYSLANHRTMKLSPQENIITSRYWQVVSSAGTGASSPLTCYRGEWDESNVYGYYDEVTYNGSTWLCVVDSTTITPPSDSNSAWQKRVSMGEPGLDGNNTVMLVITSNNGTVFKNGGTPSQITLTATAYRGEEDVTSEIDTFTWTKTVNGVTTTLPDTTRTIIVSAADVASSAMYEVSADVATRLFDYTFDEVYN